MLTGPPTADAQIYASQAETTITAYKKGEIICFGCGLKHPQSQRQADGTYVVMFPNKSNPGIKANALVKIAKFKAKRKHRGRVSAIRGRRPLLMLPLRY